MALLALNLIELGVRNAVSNMGFMKWNILEHSHSTNSSRMLEVIADCVFVDPKLNQLKW